MTVNKLAYIMIPADLLSPSLTAPTPPSESQRPPSKRRKRKGASGAASGGNKKGRPPISLAGQVSVRGDIYRRRLPVRRLRSQWCAVHFRSVAAECFVSVSLRVVCSRFYVGFV